MKELFRKIATKTADTIGSPLVFFLALMAVLIWAMSGPFFKFSDTWQLVINTSTTIITFLTVFLIQNTQNRDSKAIHLKIDEIIRSLDGARNQLIDLEDDTDEDIEKLQKEFNKLKGQVTEKKQ